MKPIPAFRYREGEMLRHKKYPATMCLLIRHRVIDIDSLVQMYLVQKINLNGKNEVYIDPRPMTIADLEAHYER